MMSLQAVLSPDATLLKRDSYYELPVTDSSEGIRANAYYFSHPEWAEEYLTYCHRDHSFKERWLAAGGDWSGK